MNGPIDEQSVRAAGMAARNPPRASDALPRPSVGHGQVGPVWIDGIRGVIVSVERVDRVGCLVIVRPAVNPNTSSEVDRFHDINGLGGPIDEIFDPQPLAFSKAAVVLQVA